MRLTRTEGCPFVQEQSQSSAVSIKYILCFNSEASGIGFYYHLNAQRDHAQNQAQTPTKAPNSTPPGAFKINSIGEAGV